MVPGPAWLLVRQGSVAAEELEVIRALGEILRDRGEMVATVLLGSASYEAETPAPDDDPAGERWVLEDDARGRGLRLPSGPGGVRSVSPAELVRASFGAKGVIQLP